MPQVIQQAAGTILAPSGIGTAQVTTREGSWLAALVGWNTVTAGQYVPLPAVSVTDSAGNLWQQAAITPVAGSAATRCAVWVAPNALPVSWVSAGLTGAAESAAWTLAEIAGMPQAASLDFAVGASGNGTALSLTGISSGADIGFAVAVSQGTGTTVVSGPGGGWAALAGGTAPGTLSAGCSVFPYFNPAIAAGTAVTALTVNTTPGWSYALCALSASASPPPQPSQGFPLVQAEAAFGADPGNVTGSTDYLFSSEYATWTDLTARTLGPAVQARIKAKRGRQYQLQQQEAGSCEVPLSNVDGAFTPANPGSPYYSNALNSNMSFQAGLSGWSPGSGGVTIAASTAVTFASGLNAVSRGSMLVTPDAGASSVHAANVPANPNYPYSGSWWIYSPGGWASGAHVQVNWSTAAGTFISTTTGSAVPVPAGVWTQVTDLGITPPGGAGQASLIVSLNGSPTSADVFYVAEAAIVAGPAAVRTGLVAMLTPVRVTAWWQGRRYPVWAGYAQQWPQEWPDMPQWGFSTLKAADALGVAAAGQMQSALIGEVLADNPYAYLPCNESYTSQVNGATPSNPFIVTGGFLQPADANGLIAVNRAAGNQLTGTYLDGNSVPVSTGLAMNFLGDNGTGMGATSYQGQQTAQRGPSMMYADPAMASALGAGGGFTAEFWFNWTGSGTSSTALLSAYGAPSSFMTNLAAESGVSNGAVLSAGIAGGTLTATFAGTAVTAPVAASQNPQHCVLEFTGAGSPFDVTSFAMWLNGTEQGRANTSFTISTAWQAVVLGPGRYSYDCNNTTDYAGFNFAGGHLALYPYLLSQARITAHYQAGANGWAGTDAATRFSQILTWGALGLKRGGWNEATATGMAEITQIGPAYQLSGQTAAAAVFAVAQSEGGRYGTQANGSLAYAERDSGYNLPVTATLADGTAAAPVILNTDPGFATGTAGWTASGGAVAASANRYGPIGSLQVTPAGTAVVSSPSFTYNGGSASAGFWVNLPSGGTATCSVTTSAATASTVMGASGSAWTFIPVTVPAAAPVSSAVLSVQAGTAPWFLAWAGLWYSPGQVPYTPKSSYGFDQTYIYNEVQSVQQDGPSQLVIYDNRGTASQAQYFRRSALTFQQNVVSPCDVSDITTWSLAEYQQPSMHVSAVTIDAAPNPLQAFPLVLTLDNGQVADVNRSPLGGAPLTETGTVERVQHDIGAGYWRTTYQLSPYGPSQNVLCADTSGFDAPGTTPSLIMAW